MSILTKQTLFIIVLTAFVSISPASDIKVTEYDSGTQIWIQAEDYDSKTAEYSVDVDSIGASVKAMHFPDYSGRLTIDQWWGQYSIDSADPDLASVSLTGTWYCWVRINQPLPNAEEADYLLVKGDDGSGTTWYDTAIAGVDDTDDMIGNAAEAAGASGIGNWKWLGQNTTAQGLAKEFVLDTDGKIVFRINEREAGAGNVRIDSICWASEPNYVPSDVDFGQAPITEGLVFEINAAHPGDQADKNWIPVLPNEVDDTQGELVDQTQISGETVADGYDWFYRFTPHSSMRDQVINIARYVDMSFINDDWCTIEAWIRVPAQVPNSKTKSTVFGNVYPDGETGWRFGYRCDPASGKYSLEFLQRDNETSQTSTQGIFHYRTPNQFDYSATEWLHMVFVKYAAEYNPPHAPGEISINHDWYANGELITHGVRTVPAGSLDDFYFQTQAPWIGATREDSFLAGDVALLRVYNRLLHAEEVLANYNAGITSAKSFQCGGIGLDINGDCKADLADFVQVANYWLEDNAVYPAP